MITVISKALHLVITELCLVMQNDASLWLTQSTFFQHTSHTILLKLQQIMREAVFRYVFNMRFCTLKEYSFVCQNRKDVLSGIFTRSLSLCFFSCSISLSPSSVSNWVSLIYSMMLAWPSLCWPCKKYQAGCLTGTVPHTHTHPAFPVQAVNDCVSKLEVSQPVAPVALTAEP